MTFGWFKSFPFTPKSIVKNFFWEEKLISRYFRDTILSNPFKDLRLSLNPIFNEVRKVCEISRNCENGKIKGEVLEPLTRYEFQETDDTKGFAKGNITTRLNILKES